MTWYKIFACRVTSLIMKPQQSQIAECSTDPHCHFRWKQHCLSAQGTETEHKHKVCERLPELRSVIRIFMTMQNGSYSELSVVGTSMHTLTVET